MSLPPLNPDKTASGIAVDPRTLDRVVPSSRRPDGSVRKELKIRPGFTPQEDVSRFRGTKQQDADRRALPKGHILGWVPPSSATKPVTPGSGGSNSGGALSKTAKKNAKRKEKKAADIDAKIKDSWDDDDDVPVKNSPKDTLQGSTANGAGSGSDTKSDNGLNGLNEKFNQLDVKNL